MNRMKRKSIKVGIMSREDFRRHTVAVARGERRPGPNEPKIWFESVRSFCQVLSEDNRELLSAILRNNPQSLNELADLTGRKPSNLSRTLHKMASYGIVELERRDDRTVRPVVKATDFQLEVSLAD